MDNTAPTFTPEQLDDAHTKLVAAGRDCSHNGPIPILEALVAAGRATRMMGMGFGGAPTPGQNGVPLGVVACGRSWNYEPVGPTRPAV